MATKFAFEGHPIYQEAIAFAYACMRRAQGMPSGYGTYGDELRLHSLCVCEAVAIALQRANGTTPALAELAQARREAVACVPIIDLAATAGVIRENERLGLRERLARLMECLEGRNVPAPVYVQEEVQ